jgi:hypothetical protein
LPAKTRESLLKGVGTSLKMLTYELHLSCGTLPICQEGSDFRVLFWPSVSPWSIYPSPW